MGTKIEWTDESWSPVTGCSSVSPGCKNCYARRMSLRLAGRYGYPKAHPAFGQHPFQVTLHDKRLPRPLDWKKPRMVFAVSMGDLFHEDVPDWYIAAVWAVMGMASDHTFQVLTKRPERAMRLLNDEGWPLVVSQAKRLVDHDAAQLAYAITGDRTPRDGWLPFPNVWLGVSAEDQQRADERIPILLQIPAAIRFVSCEPLLGPIDFDSPKADGLHALGCGGPCDCSPKLDWVIVGAETGPGKRKMNRQWLIDILEQCHAAKVPFFFKRDSNGCRTILRKHYEQFPETKGGSK